MQRLDSESIPAQPMQLCLGPNNIGVVRLSSGPVAASHLLESGIILIILALGMAYCLVALRWEYDPARFVTSGFVVSGIALLGGLIMLMMGIDRLCNLRVLVIDHEKIHRTALNGNRLRKLRSSFLRSDCQAVRVDNIGGISGQQHRVSIVVAGQSVPMRIANSPQSGEVMMLAEALAAFLHLPIQDREGSDIRFESAAGDEANDEELARFALPTGFVLKRWPTFSKGLLRHESGARIMRVGHSSAAVGLTGTLLFGGLVLSMVPSRGQYILAVDLFLTEFYIGFMLLALLMVALAVGSFYCFKKALVAEYLFIDGGILHLIERGHTGSHMRALRAMPLSMVRAIKLACHSQEKSASETLSILCRKGKDLHRLRTASSTIASVEKKRYDSRLVKLAHELAEFLRVPLLGYDGETIARPDDGQYP